MDLKRKLHVGHVGVGCECDSFKRSEIMTRILENGGRVRMPS